jgi:hypothetical protein
MLDNLINETLDKWYELLYSVPIMFNMPCNKSENHNAIMVCSLHGGYDSLIVVKPNNAIARFKNALNRILFITDVNVNDYRNIATINMYRYFDCTHNRYVEWKHIPSNLHIDRTIFDFRSYINIKYITSEIYY